MKVIVIGAGASGMMAAVLLAKNGCKPLLLERKDEAGSKLRLTGNGNCNISNRNMGTEHYQTGDSSPAFVSSVLKRFSVEVLEKELNAMGIYLKEKREGYLYPQTDSAKSVVTCFLRALDRYRADVRYHSFVTEIKKENGLFRVDTDEETFVADRVILACGGKSFPKTGSDGASFTLLKRMGFDLMPTYPALTALYCTSAPSLFAASGLRLTALATLYENGTRIGAQTGEIQITDYGLSGIPVFNLSAAIGASYARSGYQKEAFKAFEIRLDLFPSEEEAELSKRIHHLLNTFGFSFSSLEGMYHPKMIEVLKEWDVTPQDPAFPKRLAKLSKQFSFRVTGLREYDFCQVTGGGLKLSELTADFECKNTPGLFVIGEACDVTGACGGYNLHWALAGGYLSANRIINAS